MNKKKVTSKKKTSSTKAKSPSVSKVKQLDIEATPRKQMPNVWQLSKTSLLVLWNNPWLFLGIIVIYGLVNFVVVQGFSVGTGAATLNHEVSGLFHGQYRQLGSGLTVYALFLASIGSNNSANGGGYGYELLLIIVVSLALIWAIRTTANQSKVRVRDAYYRGMYPLIPFFGIFLLIGLEILPMLLGIYLYVTAVNNSIAITLLEHIIFILLALGLSAITLFLLSSSIFALYIVTLPDMTPFKALRSARKLVRKRRWPILLRLIYLPVALLIVSMVILLPIIIFAAPVAKWLFLIITFVFLAISHSYLYNFYRELLE